MTGGFKIDRAAREVYNIMLIISKLRTADERTSSVLCRGCDKPVTVVYHESQIYSVQCPRCELVTLVKANNPEQAARKVYD